VRERAPMRAETIKVLERALEIMRYLAQDPRGYSLSEVSAGLGLAKSTARRFLVTLVHQGFVEQDPETERYRLGLAILDLSLALQRNSNLVAIAQPVLERLRDLTGETAGLHVRLGDRQVCLAAVESRERIRYVFDLGQTTPLYAGAESKVLLAGMTPEERADFLARVPRVPFSETTLTDAERLREEVERVARLGHAISINELGRGAAAVAAPVRDRYGRIVAAVSVVGPLSRMTPPRLDELIPIVKEAADEVSRRLGYSMASLSPKRP